MFKSKDIEELEKRVSKLEYDNAKLRQAVENQHKQIVKLFERTLKIRQDLNDTKENIDYYDE